MRLLAPLVAISIAWGIIQTRVDTFEQRLLKVESKIEKMDSNFIKIEVRLAEIQKDIQAIGSNLKQ
jgi:septal ring factor EnvC (AmiA/AmiB activator)